MLSVYVVCWIFLQTSQTCCCIQANSVDLLQEQSDLGPHCLQKWLLKSDADDKADDNCCDCQLRVSLRVKQLPPLKAYLFPLLSCLQHNEGYS